MAFHTPPEVLLRTALRALRGGVGHSAISRLCHGSGKSFSHGAVCTKIGQQLEVQNLPLPDKVPEGKLLVAVHAAGINFADILTVQGKYMVRPKTPFVPGAEFSGVVEDVGEGVKGWKKGDRVMALPATVMGAFQSYCVLDPSMVFPAPDRLSLVEAAGTIVSYGTAMLALSHTAQLKEGETVLVTAAAGATGLAAVDIALNMYNAKVIGVCGGADKVAFLRKRGVTHAIDYQSENIREVVKEITSGKGVDVIIDQVGGDTFDHCLKSIAFEGRIVTVGYASGTIPSVPVNKLLIKSCSVRGIWWGNYAMQDPKTFVQSIMDAVKGVDEGKLHPYIGKTFPLEQVNAAFDFIMSRQSMGKVVLQMQDA